MRYLLPAVLGALSLIYVDGVAAQDTPTCVPGCANTVRGQFTQYGCVNADDAACLCANANFGFGVRDCGQTGCGATDVQIQAFLAGSFCQGKGPNVWTRYVVYSSIHRSTIGVYTNGCISSSDLNTTGDSRLVRDDGSSKRNNPKSNIAANDICPELRNSASVFIATGHRATNYSIVGHDRTSLRSHPTLCSADRNPSTLKLYNSRAAPAGGLSQGAAIGIGVGVAAAVVAIAFAGVFFFLKNRSRTHDSFDISAPPPSSGRGQGAFEKYSNDLELVSNRYEDMVPRQQPRAMV
ncbi:uncharacterized protein Triagg1_9723 [Trichoderma aggressivum f. europaeum]|uniref:CFEM domain-containing protein n=1 Tax=Trichoderma aggressivum f. europaeum TaxID=173218 RepID=A0AAE1LW98_9HYPO|nr:hypothetical protein Triagg1_9723 [Trichoderma aggressivum f. europaeum]